MTVEAKIQAANMSLAYLKDADVIGMGTGSTVECLLDLLAGCAWATDKVYVVSSKRTLDAMKGRFDKIDHVSQHGHIDVYVDGADWIDKQGIAIKGYGAALTQEKLLATMARLRVAIVDSGKVVPAVSGMSQPLPVEVLPVARSYVARVLVAKGIRVVYRENVVTDQGNVILDLYDYPWEDPLSTECELKLITGVVESGLFARDAFHTVLIGTKP